MGYILSLLFILSLGFPISSFSAQILKVKGPAVLIDTAGDDIQMGKTYYLMSKGKKRGIVKIVKLRPGQALARLIKGKALANWTLKVRNIPTQKISTIKNPPALHKGLGLGFALGYNNNSSDVRFTGTSPRLDSYVGTSVSYELLMDYKFYKKFHLRASLGKQAFHTEDTNNTQCLKQDNILNTVCRVSLSYINLDIWPRYYLNKGKHKFWGGVGISILFNPTSNNTTALDIANLKTTTFMQVGAGIDILASHKLYIPLWIEYGLYPSSDTVKMNSISFYLGLAYRLKVSK